MRKRRDNFERSDFYITLATTDGDAYLFLYQYDHDHAKIWSSHLDENKPAILFFLFLLPFLFIAVNLTLILLNGVRL